MSGFSNSQPGTVGARAAEILRDLKVAARRAPPVEGRPPFRWLEPGYSNDVYLPHIERLTSGFRSLTADEIDITIAALGEALEVATAHWSGAQVTLDLLDWLYVIAPELLAPRTLARLLTHHNKLDPAESAMWLRELTARFDLWSANLPAIGDHLKGMIESDWKNLLSRSSYNDQIDIAICLMEMVRADQPSIVKLIHDEVIERVYDKLPILPLGRPIYLDDICQPLAEAAGIKGISDRHAIAEALSVRKDLEAFVVGADPEWASSFDHYDLELV